MSLPTTILCLSYDSDADYFNQVYTLTPGYVFRWSGNRYIETLVLRIQNDLPEGFDVFAFRTVDPGTQLYTLYGNNTFVVTAVYSIPVISISGGNVVWSATGASSYNYQISTSSDFSTGVTTGTTTGTSFPLPTVSGTYYFRVSNNPTHFWSNVLSDVLMIPTLVSELSVVNNYPNLISELSVINV